MDPMDKLRLFKHRADQLARTELLQHDFPNAINFSAKRGTPLRISHTQPHPALLDPAMPLLRQFLMQKEDILLQAVYNTCVRHLTSEELRRYIIQSKKAWIANLRNGGMKLEIRGTQVSPESACRLWFSYIFHSNAKDIALLEALYPGEFLMHRFQFMSVLTGIVEHVMYLRDVITIAMKDGLFSREPVSRGT